jgi:hypothetical protein
LSPRSETLLFPAFRSYLPHVDLGPSGCCFSGFGTAIASLRGSRPVPRDRGEGRRGTLLRDTYLPTYLPWAPILPLSVTRVPTVLAWLVRIGKDGSTVGGWESEVRASLVSSPISLYSRSSRSSHFSRSSHSSFFAFSPSSQLSRYPISYLPIFLFSHIRERAEIQQQQITRQIRPSRPKHREQRHTEQGIFNRE